MGKKEDNIKKAKDLMNKLDQIRNIGASGSTDMGFVSEILGIDDFIFHGLGTTGSNDHAVNENVRLKEVLTYIKELIVFLCYDL